jgi:NRPS condensation-like uncharacterized protein
MSSTPMGEDTTSAGGRKSSERGAKALSVFLRAPIVRAKAAKPRMLSSAQERLWLSHALDPTGCLHNELVPIRIHGGLDAGALEQSLNEIVRRHAVLRTVFTRENGRLVQTVIPSVCLQLPLKQLEHLDDEARSRAYAELLSEQFGRRFNLSEGPLLRVFLLRFGPDEHVLIVSAHHIVFDKWSTAVFMRELGVLYEDLSAGRPPSLPELPIQ